MGSCRRDGQLILVLMNSLSPTGALVKLKDRYGLISEQRFDSLYNLLSVTNAMGRETKYTYQSVDLPGSETGPDGATAEWDYDVDGNLVVSRDPIGREKRTEYDAVGNITSEIDAENGRIVYQYDLEDNLLSITNEIGERLEV